MIGDNIGYLIGRSIGVRLVVRYGRYVRLNEPRLKVGQYLFLRHGGKIVFFGRFVAFLRTFAALLAGVNRMSWPHFLIMNALGGICWASLFGGGAYLFGEQMKRVAAQVFAGGTASGTTISSGGTAQGFAAATPPDAAPPPPQPRSATPPQRTPPPLPN